jgi:glycerol-3-phosphate dehydrogenase
VRADQSLGQRAVSDRPDLVAEFVHAVEHEMACSIDDVLSRRVPLALRSRERDGEVLRTVAAILASRLGWDQTRLEAEIADYREHLCLESAAYRARSTGA